MTSLITFAPGREGIDIGITILLSRAAVCLGRRLDIGVLSPWRAAAAPCLVFRSAAPRDASQSCQLAGASASALFGFVTGTRAAVMRRQTALLTQVQS